MLPSNISAQLPEADQAARQEGGRVVHLDADYMECLRLTIEAARASGHCPAASAVEELLE